MRTGEVWAMAPRIRGLRTAWVIPDGETAPVAVSRATRRMRLGAAAGRYQTYLGKAGRFVDRGELFRELHPDSPHGLLTSRARALADRPPTKWSPPEARRYGWS
jgi:hypothetical protein